MNDENETSCDSQINEDSESGDGDAMLGAGSWDEEREEEAGTVKRRVARLK
jgi:hypothetical protein